MNELLEKIIAVLLVLVIAGANLSMSITYAVANIELGKQDAATQNSNVEFNSYFEEGGHETKVSLEEPAKLLVNIKVKNAGYLKSGVIQFENANFEIAGEVKSEYIQSVTKERIVLKQINNGSDVTIEIPVSMIKGEKVSQDHFTKISNTKFTGTYVDGKGNEKSISKEVANQITWVGEAKAKVESEITKYVPYKIGEKQGIMVQTKVKVGIENAKLPMKKTKLEIQSPEIKGTKPTEVTVVAVGTRATNGEENGQNFTSKNYAYEKETGKVKIEVENTKTEAIWKNGVEDEYLVTYLYEGEGITSLAQEEEEGRKETITGAVEVYNGEETKIEIEKIETPIKVEERGTITDIEMLTSEKIEKGQIYANYNTNKKKETKYEISYKAMVANSNLVDKIEIEQGVDRFVTKEGQEGLTTVEGKNYAYNKTVSISQAVFEKMLGEEGIIEIYAGKSKIGIINKETEVKEGKYVLDISSFDNNSLSITTSKPITEGELILDVEKAIKSEIDYGKTQMQNFTKLKMAVTEKMSKTAEKEITLQEVASKAEVTVSKTDLTTVVKNEDVKIRAILYTSSLSNALYKNPSIKITLPSYIRQIDIKKADVLMANGLMIKKAPKVTTEKGAKVISIELEGSQKEYTIGAEYAGTIIELYTDITVQTLTPSNRSKITMEYSNENEVIAKKKGEVETKLNFVAPEGVVAANRISNFAEGKRDIMSISKKGGTAVLDAHTKKRTVTISGVIINNYQNSINNVAILGRIPVKENSFNNEEATFSTTLNKAVTVKGMENATVYYSDKAEATADLRDKNNNWSKTATTNSKSYLIVTENYEMKTGEGVEFAYDVEVPENLAHNNNVYETYEVHYNNLSSIGKMAEVQASSVMEMSTGQGPELSAQITPTVEIVREGQIVKMKLTVTNTGTEDATNVKAKIPVPAHTKFVKLNPLNSYDEKIDIKEEVLELGEIKVGESKDVFYDIKIDLDAARTRVENVREITHNATIIADKISEGIQAEPYKMNVNEGKISLEMVVQLLDSYMVKQGDEVEYLIYASNISTENQLEGTKVKIPMQEGISFVSAIKEDALSGKNNPIEHTYNEETNTVILNLGTISSNVFIRVKVKIDEIQDKLTMQVTAVANGTEEHYSNIESTNIAKPNLKISELTSTPKRIKEKETITYNFEITNIGQTLANYVEIIDELPEGLTFKDVVYNYAGEECHIAFVNEGKLEISLRMIEPGETIKFKIDLESDLLSEKEEKQVQNKIEVKAVNFNLVQTNSVMNIIEYDENLHPTPTEDPNPTPSPTPMPTPTPTEDPGKDPGKDPEPENTYQIKGIAWLDTNQDGKRDTSEPVLENIKVLLLNKETNDTVKDINTKESKVVQTNKEGQYTFDNLKPGQYFVMFAYDSNQYSLTKYQAQGVESTLNSDAIDMNMTLDGKRTVVGMTDVITITSKDIENIDIGLYTSKRFDLKLDKYIDKITLTTPTIGKKVYNYNDSKAAKIEVLGSSLDKSNIVIEYKIVVTNEGEIEGYAKKIVDYLPEELSFNTELNTDWYLSENGNLYNASLSNTIIKPGESKELTLIVSKKITSDSLGDVIGNKAEIYESYNEYGLPDADSVVANKQEQEDDMSEAKLILSIVTGTIIKYTALSLGIIAILGLGIFVIKQKVINKKENN